MTPQKLMRLKIALDGYGVRAIDLTDRSMFLSNTFHALLYTAKMMNSSVSFDVSTIES